MVLCADRKRFIPFSSKSQKVACDCDAGFSSDAVCSFIVPNIIVRSDFAVLVFKTPIELSFNENTHVSRLAQTTDDLV